jgi:hypothetical protein
MGLSDDEPGDDGVYHVQFDTTEEDPVFDIVSTVAELESVGVTDLPSLHDTVDHVIDQVFSTPPDESAQLRIEFTYADYRIELYQDGRATFMKIAESATG